MLSCMFVMFLRLARGSKIEDLPISPNLLHHKFKDTDVRLMNLERGYKRDYPPTAPIELLFKFNDML